jgi:hypothetical protein
MAIIQALLAAVTRSAGKLLNTVFAWATVLLFGRVPEDRQIYVSAIAFGSVIWLVVLVGVAFPAVGTFLLAFVPLPEWIDETWVRLAMLAAVVVIPAVVGAISLLMLEKSERPRGAGAVAKAVLRGYPYTVGLALTLTLMTLFAPIIKIRTLAKRWTSEHVPVLIEAEDYLEVVDAAKRALQAGGFKTARRRPSWLLRAPTKILTTFARGAVADLVADRMTLLASRDVEVLLHPSDLVISAREGTAARARAVLAERLVFTPAHLTWSKEANEIEDRLVAIWRARNAESLTVPRRALAEVERDVRELEIPYEEWEVLFREMLLVERALTASEVARAAQSRQTIDVDAIANLADALDGLARQWRRARSENEGGVAAASAAAVAVLRAFADGPRRRAA